VLTMAEGLTFLTTLCPNYFPQAPPPNTICIGFGKTYSQELPGRQVEELSCVFSPLASQVLSTLLRTGVTQTQAASQVVVHHGTLLCVQAVSLSHASMAVAMEMCSAPPPPHTPPGKKLTVLPALSTHMPPPFLIRDVTTYSLSLWCVKRGSSPSLSVNTFVSIV
jgi:hypothetical protein